MALCTHCGVDIGELKTCPLCKRLVNGVEPTQPTLAAFPVSTEKRVQIFEVVSVSILIAAAAVTIVNLVIDGRLSWAWFPLLSLIFVWVVAALPIIISKKPWLIALIDILGLSAFLFGLDVLTGPGTWFLGLVLPMIGGLVVGIAIVLSAYALSKRKGINIIGWILLAAAEFCLSIEAAISFFTSKHIQVFWSSIVASSLVPVALFLFYLHYRVAKAVTLKKLFHL